MATLVTVALIHFVASRENVLFTAPLLEDAFEAFWNGWRRLREVFPQAFGYTQTILTGRDRRLSFSTLMGGTRCSATVVQVFQSHGMTDLRLQITLPCHAV